MGIGTKRIIAAAIPILVTLLVFVAVDALLVRKHTDAHRENLLVAAHGARGLLIDQQATVVDRLRNATNEKLTGLDQVEGALSLAGLGETSSWVVSDSAGSVILSSNATLAADLGTTADNLFGFRNPNDIAADLTVREGVLYVKAYGPIDSAGNHLVLGVLVPVSTAFDSQVLNGVDAELEIGFYSPSDDAVIGSDSSRLTGSGTLVNFHEALARSKTPASEIVESKGNRLYVAGAPLLDFEQWDVHGHAVASLPESAIMRSIRATRLAVAGIGLVAVLVALLAMAGLVRVISDNPPSVAHDSNTKRRIRARVVLTTAVMLLPTALGVGWGMIRSNDVSAQTMAASLDTLAAVGERVAQRTSLDRLSDADELKARLREMERATDIDFTMIRADGSRVSTLREERVGFDPNTIDVWYERNGVLVGILRINFVIHRVVVIPTSDAGAQLVVTLEDTPYQNLLASNNATSLGTLLVAVLISVAAVWVVITVHRERTFRLALAGFLFLTPALVILLWWAVGPLLFSLFLTFHRWSIVNPAKPFVGFANYVRMFGDRLWWRAMLNTGYYVLHIPVAMAVSLAVAMAMNRDLKGITVFRTIFYLPTVNSLVVTALMWRLLFNPEFGLLNFLLGKVGLPGLAWLSHPTTAMPSIMLVTVWFTIGGQMILFLAGLKNIPKTYYEVAEIDGSTALHKFWYITLPLLRPTLLFVLITSTIGSFQVFTQVYMLTEGGPAGSTDVAMYRIYSEAWYNLRMGYGATEAWTLCLVIFLFTALQFRFFNRELKYA